MTRNTARKTGDEYTGGGWSELGEGELFETVEEKLGWQMYSNGRFSASSLYGSMYFMMNVNVQAEEPLHRLVSRGKICTGTFV